MMTDLELLRRYVEEESEDAFTEIARRHVDLVYGAALRQLCGNASLAAVGTLLSQQVVAAPVSFAEGVATSAFADTVAALALGCASYQYLENAQRRDEVARLTQERDALRDQLRQSQQRAVASAERALRAQQEQSDLQQKLDGALAVKAKPQPIPKKISDDEAEKRVLRDKKMMQMKPLLEAGMPIKGALVVTTAGKAVSHPVEFVIGKETKVESDDGTYSLTPSLEPDGSVKYRIELMKQTKNEETGVVSKRKMLCYAISVPWLGYTLQMTGGAVMALESDLPEP